MRNSHKILLAAVVLMIASLKPDFAAFIPQVAKVIAAGALIILGLYMMWKERQW